MVLAGTFLAGVTEREMEGLLRAGQAVPFVGCVCRLLYDLGQYVGDFNDVGEECQRLSVDPIECPACLYDPTLSNPNPEELDPEPCSLEPKP